MPFCDIALLGDSNVLGSQHFSHDQKQKCGYYDVAVMWYAWLGSVIEESMMACSN